MPDPEPTYDRCPLCGRVGRTMSIEGNVAGVIGSDNRVLPLQELELEIAAHVGAATLKAGELDATMSGLNAVAGPPEVDSFGSTWGRSGAELTKALLSFAGRPNVDAASREQLTRLCERYDALYETRNDLIHSFRPGRGSDRLDVVRAIRIKRGQSVTDTDDLTQRRRLGLGELVDLYYDLDDLTHEARNFYFRLIGLVE